jgi:hypothetical protein
MATCTGCASVHRVNGSHYGMPSWGGSWSSLVNTNICKAGRGSSLGMTGERCPCIGKVVLKEGGGPGPTDCAVAGV